MLEIGDWTAINFGIEQAIAYVQFLRDEIGNLIEEHESARRVSHKSKYRYRLMKKKTRGYGHIAVFEVTEDSVIVLQIFHTAQDWQRYVADSRNL